MTKLKVALIAFVALAGAVLGAYLFAEYGHSAGNGWAWVRTQLPMAVDHVADGDSIVVEPNFFGKPLEVRLLGVNTKEIEHAGLRIKEECYGKEAKDYVTNLLKGKLVTISYDPLKGISPDGNHDRLIGYVRVYDNYLAAFTRWGTDLNLDLLQKGYAEEWLYQGNYGRSDEFLAAEQKAKQENVGGWKACPDFKKHPRGGTRKRGKKRVADHD